MNPIDEVDTACREHDNCYANTIMGYINNKKYPPKPNTLIDEKMCDVELIATVEKFAKKARLFSFTPDNETKKLTAASLIHLYFKSLKKSTESIRE